MDKLVRRERRSALQSVIWLSKLIPMTLWNQFNESVWAVICHKIVETVKLNLLGQKDKRFVAVAK
jgi:hypothetical protein